MTIEQIKYRMLNWKYFYGGDIPATDDIRKAKTKKELRDILVKHSRLMEDMLCDATGHLDNFKKELGLNLL